ncbi:MAG: glycosyltransferase [Thermoanaerobaculia bacterium]
MKVALLIHSLAFGGAERQVTMLARGLAERGHRVHLVTLYDHDELKRDLQGTAVECVSLGKRGRGDLVGFGWRFVRAFCSIRPHVIYSFLPMQNLLTMLLKIPGAKWRIVWGVRASRVELSLYGGVSRITHRLALVGARVGVPDRIVCNSFAARNELLGEGVSPERIAVVPNGIDCRRFRPMGERRSVGRQAMGFDPEDIVLGFVGRIDPMKDLPTLLRGFAMVAHSDRRLHLACVGNGPETYRSSLRQLVRELGVRDRVRWFAARENVEDIYNAIDLLVSPSRSSEGFSNVIAEAMACGVPCVVTDVGDSARIVGPVGTVIPPKNAGRLAEAITEQLARRGSADSIRKSIESRFGLDAMVDSTEAILAALVRSN